MKHKNISQLQGVGPQAARSIYYKVIDKRSRLFSQIKNVFSLQAEPFQGQGLAALPWARMLSDQIADECLPRAYPIGVSLER